MTGHHVLAQLPILDSGVCSSRRYNPELWFSDDPAYIGKAVGLCQGCPIKAPCLAGALDRRERHGVWGGKRFGRRDTREGELRAWAAEVGVGIAKTGRIPAWLEEAFEQSRDLLAAADEALHHAAAHRPRKTA